MLKSLVSASALHALWLAAAPSLLWIAAGVVSLAVLQYLSHRETVAGRVETFLLVAKTHIASAIPGGRGDLVIDAWLNGLEAIKDGRFTEDEAAQILMDFISIAMKASVGAQSLDAAESDVVKAVVAKTALFVATYPSQPAAPQVAPPPSPAPDAVASTSVTNTVSGLQNIPVAIDVPALHSASRKAGLTRFLSKHGTQAQVATAALLAGGRK